MRLARICRGLVLICIGLVTCTSPLLTLYIVRTTTNRPTAWSAVLALLLFLQVTFAILAVTALRNVWDQGRSD